MLGAAGVLLRLNRQGAVMKERQLGVLIAQDAVDAILHLSEMCEMKL